MFIWNTLIFNDDLYSQALSGYKLFPINKVFMTLLMITVLISPNLIDLLPVSCNFLLQVLLEFKSELFLNNYNNVLLEYEIVIQMDFPCWFHVIFFENLVDGISHCFLFHDKLSFQDKEKHPQFITNPPSACQWIWCSLDGEWCQFSVILCFEFWPNNSIFVLSNHNIFHHIVFEFMMCAFTKISLNLFIF